MAIPSVGGGYQFGDGNLNEIDIISITPQAATTTATLTVAQVTNTVLVATAGTSAVTYTLPTAASLDATLTNAKVGSSFRLSIVNLGTSSGVVTVAAGTGITLVGTMTFAITGVASTSPSGAGELLFYKTGTATYNVYRIS
jgi:hypothetical protein